MKNGFIPVQRAIFSHKMWTERRRFSRFEAWLDIQRRALVYDTDTMSKGEVKLNVRKTAQAWGWSTSTVSLFIRSLIGEGMLERTGKKSVYKMPNNISNTKSNAADADNQHTYAEPSNNQSNNMPNTLPINIKEKIKENACARGTRDANGDEELFARFHEWARQNLPTLASGIDIATFRMMRGRTYGSTAKMLKVLQAMEGEGCQGDILREYERRCPR